MASDECAAGAAENPGTTRSEFLRGALATGVAVGAGGLISACGGGSSNKASVTTSTPAVKLRQGGTLTIGLGSGSTADTVGPWAAFSGADGARQYAIYDSLMTVRGSIDQLEPVYRLAQEITPNKDGSEWTIRLKSGVEFHNGKTVDADDVIYTFNLIQDPKTGSYVRAQYLVFDMKGARKLDKLTVRIPTFSPTGIVPQIVSNGTVQCIVPVGFDIKHPVGAGPFKLVSFSPGQETVLERFPNYYGDIAKIDTLRLVELPDDSARYNALLSGQIDVMDIVPYNQLASLEANSGFHVSNLRSAQWAPIYTRVDLAPFSDVRVRQALRLAADRNEIVASAYAGAATHGSDVFGIHDPAFDTSLVRNQDTEQAKSLLKQAGHENLTVTLTNVPVSPGSTEQCEAYARTVAAAGINVKLRLIDPGTYFGPNYLSWPFSVDTWPGLNYLFLVGSDDGPGAAVNETHFSSAKFNALTAQARRTLDPTKRTDIIHDMQQIEFTEGGNIIPCFPNYTAAYTTKVGGFYPANLTGDAVAAGFYNLLGFVA